MSLLAVALTLLSLGAVSYRWRLDGRRVAAKGARLTARLATSGRHRVGVEVADGHGGRATVAASVLVRA